MDDDEKLSAMLDGELTPQELIELEARLANDPALQARLDAFKQADELIRAAFGKAKGNETLDRVASAIYKSDTNDPAINATRRRDTIVTPANRRSPSAGNSAATEDDQ